jgi:hypothetical protein
MKEQIQVRSKRKFLELLRDVPCYYSPYEEWDCDLLHNRQEEGIQRLELYYLDEGDKHIATWNKTGRCGWVCGSVL